MKNRRIGVIGIKGLPAFGGAATVAENLIKELSSDYDITVYTVNSHSHTEAFKKNCGYEIIVFRKFFLTSLNTLSYYLKSLFHVMFCKNFDLIHLHHGSSGFITPILRLKYKVVLTLHGIYRHGDHDSKFSLVTNLLMKLSQKLNLLFASEIVSVSASDANYLLKKNKYRVKVIPNGVSITNQPPHTTTVNDPETTTPLIAFAAGRIYDIKGLHILLEALIKISLPYKLMVIGNLDEVDTYRNKILTLSKDLNVTFIPLIKEKDRLFELISRAQIFVFPSLTEAMSMMLLEVASLEVPIIASDIEANKNVFCDDEVLFFENNISQDLAKKIIFALTNLDQMEKWAAAAKVKVAKNYTWPRIAEQYRGVFNSVLMKN